MDQFVKIGVCVLDAAFHDYATVTHDCEEIQTLQRSAFPIRDWTCGCPYFLICDLKLPDGEQNYEEQSLYDKISSHPDRPASWKPALEFLTDQCIHPEPNESFVMSPEFSTRRGLKRRGVAAVEFAMVVPFFILLVFGMIEISRGIMVHQILINAAREGAREAILDGATVGDVRTVVANYLAGADISGSPADVSPNPASAASRTAITVTVTVPANNVSWLVSSRYFPAGSVFSASATMLNEAD